jgi:hypothetical protein
VVSQIVIVLDQLRRKDFDEWGTVAEEVVSSLIPDIGAYIEGTFRSWAGLAQSQLQGSKRSQDALFWLAVCLFPSSSDQLTKVLN